MLTRNLEHPYPDENFLEKVENFLSVYFADEVTKRKDNEIRQRCKVGFPFVVNCLN